MFIQALKMAWESIRSNKMRSFLTMLGIIIGVFSLTVMVSIVRSATNSVSDQLSSLTSNSLEFMVIDDKGSPLTTDDMQTIQQLDSVKAISPKYQTQAKIKDGRNSENGNLYGVSSVYAEIEEMELSAGRFIKSPDEDSHTNVAVITNDVMRDIMKIYDPSAAVGRQIKVGGLSFEVIGVIKQSDNSVGGDFVQSDYSIYIPYTTLQRMAESPGRNISDFVVQTPDGNLTAAQDEVGNFLLERFKNDSDSFYAMNMQTFVNQMNSVMNILTLLLGGIAGISLLVGGIGIMNIMLVSVTERTREIGIRKAIGATRRVILIQFLFESLMLSLIGCAIGIVLSQVALSIGNVFQSQISLSLSPMVALVSTAFSLGIGLIFGIYPANKAAKMKPIDALRYND